MSSWNCILTRHRSVVRIATFWVSIWLFQLETVEHIQTIQLQVLLIDEILHFEEFASYHELMTIRWSFANCRSPIFGTFKNFLKAVGEFRFFIRLTWAATAPESVMLGLPSSMQNKKLKILTETVEHWYLHMLKFIRTLGLTAVAL